MIITHHREKLINAIIYFATHTKLCGKIKLMKLLYYLDFFHFRETAKSVTGLEYFAWEMGPVPRTLFGELSRMKPDLRSAISISQVGPLEKIVAKKKFNNKYFTKRQMRLLKDVAFIFRDAKAGDMIDVTHLPNTPYDKTLLEKGEFEKIDYLLSIDDERGSLSYSEARERVKEISEMHEVFGTT